MTRKSDLLLRLPEQPVIEGMESEEGLAVSEEEYWQHYYNRDDFSYEWNNGVLEVKPMADYQSMEVYQWFENLLEEYIQYNPIAKIIFLDIGFRMSLTKKVTIRKPDLALILKTNTVDISQTDSTFKGIYDVCVEFLSDSKKTEVERDTVVKRAEYEQAGVKEYYIIDRKGKETAFFYLSKKGSYLPMRAKAGIIQSSVLPGWQFRIDDLYRKPDLKTLIKDPIYRSFVLLDYQKSLANTKRAKEEAKQAKKEAEQEAQRAEQEAKLRLLAEQQAKQEALRAEKLAAKLREMGIDPDSLS